MSLLVTSILVENGDVPGKPAASTAVSIQNSELVFICLFVC